MQEMQTISALFLRFYSIFRQVRGDEKMSLWVPWLIAIASTTALIALWLWEVKRTLRHLKSTMDSAADQLTAFKRKASDVFDPQQTVELEKVIGRSKSIYLQAAEHYNNTLDKLWIFLPGRVLGFKKEIV